MSNTRTHYDNLQIARTASDAVVRSAYRVLSQQHHPDKNLNDRANAERRMKIINEAYAVLSDPVKRREHDQWIMQMEADTKTSKPHISPSVAATQAAYDFVVYPSKIKMAFLFLLSLSMATLSSLFIDESSFFRKYFDYFGITVFGLTCVFFFTRLINPSPSIVINEHGIQIITFGGAALRWSEIADVRIEEYGGYGGNRFLAIFLKNPEIVMKRQSLWRRVLTKVNVFFTGIPPAIVISENLVGMSLEQLIGEITSRAPRE